MKTIQKLMGHRNIATTALYCEVSDAIDEECGRVGLNWAKSTTKRQFGAMIRRIPVFQQGAVCLTKFGPESGETAKEIVARKDLERRSGIGAHKNEFWWGIGEKGTAQSIKL